MSEKGTSVMGQMADELKLQAWLAAAEFQNPSLHDADTRAKVDVLAAMRDELRLQAHLGTLEAKADWEVTEKRWRHFMSLASDAVATGVHDVLADIKAAYADMTTDVK